jgi:zinc transport system substrate-binding protein
MDAHNAITWVGAIAAALSELDPANAAIYAANADKAAKDLDGLAHDLEHQLEDYTDAHFVVFHDAYQYFEHMTGLKASGALLLSDATPPSAAQLSEIQEEIEEHNITCIFSEPQFSDALVRSVTNGTVGSSVLDPLGVDLELGPNLYTELLQGLANSFESCLK